MSKERRQENVDYEKNYYNPRAYDNKQKKAQKLVKWKNVSVKTKKENDRSSRERESRRKSRGEEENEILPWSGRRLVKWTCD